MTEYIVNHKPMDPRLVAVPNSIGLKDKSYRNQTGSEFGKWEIVSGGVREALLYITRQTYPDAILVGNEHDADKALRNADFYQEYLDRQPTDYGEQEFYAYHASGNLTELVQAHIPQDLAIEFRVMCQRKRIKQREAISTLIAEWVK